jgi:acetoin utilization deacetylase AcuC-like enzyme
MAKDEQESHPSVEARTANLKRIYPVVMVKPPEAKPVIPQLPQSEKALLGKQLKVSFDASGNPIWPDDWAGNLQLFFSPINGKTIFCDYYRQEWRTLVKFFSHIIHWPSLPSTAANLLQFAASRRSTSVEEKFGFMKAAAERCFYDPDVLKEDGWTIGVDDQKGSNYVGCSVFWQSAEAVIIAYVRDNEIGDMWKIMWVADTETADLEYNELEKALRAWERKLNQTTKKRSMADAVLDAQSKGSNPYGKPKKNRYGDPSYVVPTVDSGVVLAATGAVSARPDVLWPARICHDDEIKNGNFPARIKKAGAHSVMVVFLAPYWTHQQALGYGGARKNSEVGGQDLLFDYEQVDASPKTLQSFPHSSASLDIEDLKTSFRLTGLAKNHFGAYVNAHRLALGFGNYAAKRPNKADPEQSTQLAQLKDCHVMSLRTPSLPLALLSLPWSHVLKQLPHPSLDDNITEAEPCLNLNALYHCMGPAVSQSLSDSDPIADGVLAAPVATNPLLATDKQVATLAENGDSKKKPEVLTVSKFVSGQIRAALDAEEGTDDIPLEMSMLGTLLKSQLRLIQSFMSISGSDTATLAAVLTRLLTSTLALKAHGASILKSTYPSLSQEKVGHFLREWRIGCERIFSHTRAAFSSPSIGVGCCAILTDERCRLHLTGPGSFERAVRLPAAIKGAQNAGAGKTPDFLLLDNVEQKWCELAKETILPMCHGRKYLNRMRQKINEINALKMLADGRVEGRGEPLSEDSDNEGGADTGGSRGSYDAAVAGVASALKAVDMVCRGQIVSAFCATRPPGHHAGTELRAMNAPSNGFCVFNSVAAAAKYAVTPRDQGGFGLSRVAVIDFDVHHGNGTQEILGRTYDPKFLYVSMHAGDPSRGGSSDGNDGDGSDDEGGGDAGKGRKKKEEDNIFPGDCGGSSPHPGVLNIPMGDVVTSAAVGHALSTVVKDRVGDFSPDLILISAGFDAHKNDPLGLGGLSTSDFANVTEICCRFAESFCSGRVVSVLEGGYGVPCCKPPQNLFLPAGAPAGIVENGVGENAAANGHDAAQTAAVNEKVAQIAKQTRERIGWTDEFDMEGCAVDDMPSWLSKQLVKCAEEGFLECVEAHVGVLKKRASAGSSKP